MLLAFATALIAFFMVFIIGIITPTLLIVAAFILMVLIAFLVNYRKIELKNDELIAYYWWRPKSVFKLSEMKNIAIRLIYQGKNNEPYCLLYLENNSGKLVKFAFRGKSGIEFAEEVVKTFELSGGKSRPIVI